MDTSRHLSICRALLLFYKKDLGNFSLCLLDLSWLFSVFFTSQTLSSLLKPSTHVVFDLVSNHLVWSLYLLFFMHFMHLGLGFGFLKFFWGFSKLMKLLWNFWDGCCLNEFKTSCIASQLHYNNVSCILDVCLLCCYVVCW